MGAGAIYAATAKALTNNHVLRCAYHIYFQNKTNISIYATAKRFFLLTNTFIFKTEQKFQFTQQQKRFFFFASNAITVARET